MQEMIFPCRLDHSLGCFMHQTEREEVAQSVRLILTTRPGERPLRPEFGTNLDRFVFESKNTTTRNLIRREVMSSLLEWEPRIADVSVELRTGEHGELLADVAYELVTSGQSDQVTVHLTRHSAT